MSDFSIIGAAEKAVYTRNAVPQEEGGYHFISKHKGNVSQNTKVPTSLSVRDISANQQSTPNNSRSIRQYKFVKKPLSKVQNRAEPISKLTARQNQLLSGIVYDAWNRSSVNKSASTAGDDLKAFESNRIFPIILQINNNKEKLIESIVEQHKSRGNIYNSAFAWLCNQNLFKQHGVTKAQFCEHANIELRTLSPEITRIKCKLRREQKSVKTPVESSTGIKMETSEPEKGILEITLDDSGNEVDSRVIPEPKLKEKAVIDNNLPICCHPDNPMQSRTFNVLGLDSHAEVEDLKVTVTNWGSMNAVFEGMPIKKRTMLKFMIINEMYQQIIAETQQGERMDRLMKNAGSHYLSYNQDEIINLGVGVFNPGISPVPAYTVLGFYAGQFLDLAAAEKAVRTNGSVNSFTYSWATKSTKFSVDAFKFGNILRNINTGKLPDKPLLAENNVAAVQVNSRLMAYITTREIAAGEEYFVDYGVGYNPLAAIDAARVQELEQPNSIKQE